MDPKAAAKSKRSHTVHGRRNHPTPSTAAAHKQKRASTTTTPSSSSSARGRKLPSNWDRYDDEAEADDSVAAASAAWPGEVAPRSKGADFAFLLEQARAQPREVRGVDTPWLASQDSSFDFLQGSNSMFEAKGEGILSWCQDDNFIVDNDLVADFEVPFLSMDLHALATQLSKIKLSQRLFIEEDLLPEELADESEGNQISSQPEMPMESKVEDSSVQQPILRDMQHVQDVMCDENARNSQSEDQMKNDLPLPYSEVGKSTTSHSINTQVEYSNTEEATSYTVPRIIGSVPGTGQRQASRFEVSAAEEELDMLLNSFSKTNLSSSNLDESFRNNSSFRSMTVSESNEKVASSTSSRSLVVTPLDDALDDLLSETSLAQQSKGDATSLSTFGGYATANLTSQASFNSDQNCDFRSAKKIDIMASLDSVDELLVDTLSYLKDQSQTTSAQGQDNIPNVNVSSHSGAPNTSNDFDSL